MFGTDPIASVPMAAGSSSGWKGAIIAYLRIIPVLGAVTSLFASTKASVGTQP